MKGRIVGLPGPGAWGLLARCLLARRPVPSFSLPAFSGPLVMVCRDQEELEDVSGACAAFSPLFGEASPVASFGEDARGRLASLELLGRGRLILAIPEAFSEPLPSPGEFSERSLALQVGQALGRSEALERLERAGYRRVDFVESPGEYAARGAVVDFYGLEPPKAVRVLFDEDSVVSLRSFDPGTQATLDFLGEAKAICAWEGTGRLGDWIGQDSLWIAAEGVRVDLPRSGSVYQAGGLLETSGSDIDFGACPNSPFGGDCGLAAREILARAREGCRVLLYSLNRGEDSRIQELFEERIPRGACQFLVGPLRRGFRHPGLGLAVLSTSEIFGRHYRPSARWRFFAGRRRSGLWRELRQGDFVVHQDYGIARFVGLRPVESPGHGVLDCLALEFRGSDTLYVPMTEFGRVQKYSGAEGARPRLSSLDSRRWEELKSLVREGVRELAQELLRLEAQRQSRPGHAFPPEAPMEREFAEAFPYEETQDQARAIAEVLSDMQAPHPMDRLVIGDVGFGKTEVAMRAAFKCAAGYKQAAVLVPTTILADQHFRTFSARLADYPVRVGVLTRFQSRGEQGRVLEALAAGTMDVVIGTSRLLQRDVAFKDLGLVIIDEEHRFGVRDKERLKGLRRSVDCLSLSATPIPRSLHQALSGLRRLSLIQSAPSGRQPILTRVGPWDEGVVAEAIEEELARGGQVYYVHNRVSSLPGCLEKLKRLLPEARFSMVHGRMRGLELEKAMWDFFNRTSDVLVASTIIESGLDIPSVNTLLVENAQDFGLAQLYQLRGRIGRERRRAVCCLFYPARARELSALTEQARARLEALKEFGELGSGLRLALRDLEIRGAGDLLGARQHGFLNAVGAEFYTQMLEEEMDKLSGRGPEAQEAAVSLDLRLPAYIPEDYLPDEMKRLEFYKRMLGREAGEADALRRELEDLCGPAPEPVRNLLALLWVRRLAQRAGLGSVTQKAGRLELIFRPGAPVDAATLSPWMRRYEGRIWFLRSAEGDGLGVDLGGEPALAWIKGFLSSLGSPAQK